MAKQSLLVADADPRSLRILEVALRKAGFAVSTATDGAEVLRKLQRTQLDALLCELSLPGEDGLAVCRSVRADARLGALPILLMNADREPATRAAALQAGADDFLPKPLLVKEVVARVRTLLAQREQDRNSQKGVPPAITGTVGDLGLVDLFTSLDNWQRSAVVVCEGDGRSARVWVRDGQVVDAEVPPLSGEPAFYRLLNWDAGSFRVDFEPVYREARTDAGTQGLLMEGMRRIDEMARLAETLPLSTVLAVDFPRLLTHLAEMPDELNGVLRLFDGVRTVREVIAGSPIDDLSTMAAVQKLMSDGVLVRGAPAAPRQKPSLQQWLGSTPEPPSGSGRAPAPSHVSPVADEDLPVAEVLVTPPEGHSAARGESGSSPSQGPSTRPGSTPVPARAATAIGTPPAPPAATPTPLPPSPPAPVPAPPPTARGRTFSTDSHATQPVRHRHAAVSVPPTSVRIGGTGAGATPEGAGGPGAGEAAGTGTGTSAATREGRHHRRAEARGGAAEGRGGTPAGASASTLGTIRIGVGAGRIVLFRYPPQRGTRRERLRREAEEARQAIAAGRPVRMTHVLELPPTPGGGDATPEDSRRMSAAVGEVAKRFAPDLPIGRLVRPWAGAPGRAGSDTAAGESGAPKSAPASSQGARPSNTSQQIGAALADALAASHESANEAPGAETLRSSAAAPAPRAASVSARRPRVHVAAAIVAAVAVVASLSAGLYVRRHHQTGASATPVAEPTEPNTSTSVVPAAPSAAPAQAATPAEPPPTARPPPANGAAEYARAFATGESLLKQGRYRAAIGEYRKAVAVRPDSVPALIALGDAFLEADQPRNAIKPLLQAAQLDPGNARAQLLLGTAFQSLNRAQDAVSAYKRYLELDPNGEFANDVRAIVANLSR